MRGRRAVATASQMLLVGVLVSPGPPSASSDSELLMDPELHPPPPESSNSAFVMDLSKDTVGGFAPVLAQVVSGSSGGDADGIYACLDSVFKCVHERKPLLRLEEGTDAIDQPNGETHHMEVSVEEVDGSFHGSRWKYVEAFMEVDRSSGTLHDRHDVQQWRKLPLLEVQASITSVNGSFHDHILYQMWRTIVNGSTTLYSSSLNMHEGDITTDEDWVWLSMATSPPRHTPSLDVVKIRDTGCLGLQDKMQRGWQGNNIASREAALEAQLGDIYTRAGRLSDALACYSSAVTSGTLSSQQRCRVDLALCTVATKQAKKVTTSGPLLGDLEEAACISSLLARAGDTCSADDAATAHITVGVFHLCEKWDTGGALDHFLAATAQREDFSGEGEGEREDEVVAQGDGFEWGPVWLAQAIRGQAQEASDGFAANTTAFGEAWAGTHLRNWRHHLERKCSGVGMGGIIEGAERLVLTGTRGGGGRGGGDNGHANGRWPANSAAVVDLHLALARTLILHGAFEEAGGHVRAAEKLAVVEGIEWSAEGEVRSDAASAVGVALRLEMALLSRTPVVLESGDSTIPLRRELLAVLEQLGKSKGFLGSIPSPLNVGVRAQFLTTYQGLDDKATAIALAKVFDQASGGTLSYCSPHLHSASESSDQQHFDKGGTRVLAAAEQTPPPRDKDGAPPAVEAWADIGSQSSEIPDTDTHQGYAQTAVKGPMADANVNEKVIRVGFVSSHFRWHSVGRLAVGLLEHLSRSADLDIFVVCVSTGRGSAKGQSIRLHESGSLPNDKDSSYRKSGTPNGSVDDVASNAITARLAAAGASIVKIPLADAEGLPLSDGSEATAAISVGKRTDREGGTSNHSLHRARQAIAALALDVLVFGDVGMDALTTSVAYGRLCPVQVAFWGHPGTTGLPTVDYFITSDLFEGKTHQRAKGWCSSEHALSGSYNESGFHRGSAEARDGTTRSTADGSAAARGGNRVDLSSCGAERWEDRQGAFSEQLVRLDGLGIIFDDPVQTFNYNFDNNATANSLRWTSVGEEDSNNPPEAKRTTLDKSAIGKAGGGVSDSSRMGGDSPPPGGDDSPTLARENANRPRLYVCAQSLMKMHPAFDAVLAGILSADPLAHIVLLRDSRQLLWHSRFRRRLRAAIDDAEGRAITARFVNGTAIATLGSEPHRYPSPLSNDDEPRKTSTPSCCSAAPRTATCAGTISKPPQRERSETAAAVDSGGTAGSEIGQNCARKEEHYPHPQQHVSTAAMGGFWNRVRFVSPLSGRDFFRLQCRADVVLDPFPFGGGVTMLEALTCGTPVVTAGELQSVHRLAEGMIIAADGAAAARDTAEHGEREETDAGIPAASTTGAVTSSAAATTAALNEGGEEVGDGHPARHRRSSERNRPRARKRSFGRDKDDVDRRAGAGERAEVDAVSGSDGTCSLVDRLVAATMNDYITKAVALAAPGQLRECVVRALERGRDGILRGDGVARDWERFLKIAAASPTAATKMDVFRAKASQG